MSIRPRSALARPKINLFLHVTGQRSDGYHLLESLVVFAETGDRLRADPDSKLSLHIDGPFAQTLGAGPDNLVVRAARCLQAWAQDRGYPADGAAIHLTKTLPIASGIGGGSADAAATLNVLKRLWRVEIDAKSLARIALELGADVPVCLASRPRIMAGVGDRLTDAPALPAGGIVLVNPLCAVPTSAVFAARANSGAPFSTPLETHPGPFETVGTLANWLTACTGNDLQMAARTIAPEIADVLAALEGCRDVVFSRMSGSGATCFGLCETHKAAMCVAQTLVAAHPTWWIEAAAIAVDDPTDRGPRHR